MPVEGEVLEANAELEEHPEYVNEDPYGKGWIIRIAMQNPAQVEDLMDAKAYEASL